MSDIMAEKEFFDVMKNANRFLTGEERHQIATTAKTYINRWTKDTIVKNGKTVKQGDITINSKERKRNDSNR